VVENHDEMGKTCDKTRDHMHTGSIPKNGSEIDKEMGRGSCNKLPQPQLKMFS
jgi:hypothetical protein